MCVWPVEGEMVLEKGSGVKLLMLGLFLVATALSVGASRKGVVCIRLFKVVPTASASPSPQAGGNQICLLRRHIQTGT